MGRGTSTSRLSVSGCCSDAMRKSVKSRLPLFALGRNVNIWLPPHTGIRPTRDDFRAAAKELNISINLAMRAWHTFIWN
jgi:hypothetical protein